MKCSCITIMTGGNKMILFSMTSPDNNQKQQASRLIEHYISKIGQGDGEALAKVYELTRVAVYGFALSLLKNRYDAEDVLQETYVRLYQSAGTYQAKGKPMAYLFIIAKNLCLMKLRSAKRIIDIEDWDWDNIIVQQPEVTIEDKIVLTAAREVLSSQENQIVMLYTTAGLKHREIADLLQLPLATVLSKYRRSIKKLKTKLMEGE